MADTSSKRDKELKAINDEMRERAETVSDQRDDVNERAAQQGEASVPTTPQDDDAAHMSAALGSDFLPGRPKAEVDAAPALHTTEWHEALMLIEAGIPLLKVEDIGAHFPICYFDDADGQARKIIANPTKPSGAQSLMALHMPSAKSHKR